MKRIALWTLLGGLLLSACAPALVVRHRDPTRPKAVVWIDGEQAGTVDYDGEASFTVSVGPHTVRVVPPDAEKSPWHDERQLVLILEHDGILTLMPRQTPQ